MIRHISLDDFQVPLQIIIEKRNNIRISVTSKCVNLRIPVFLDEDEVCNRIRWAEDWVLQLANKKPQALAHFTHTQYVSGMAIQTPRQNYKLYLESHHKKGYHAQLNGQDLAIFHPMESDRNKITKLIAKCISADQYDSIYNRVNELNQAHFKVNISDVKLKYMHSRWGSCHVNGIITLSSKLLLVPGVILDHVIIHELAHRIYADHSPNFWALVAKADPDYKAHKRWLHQIGRSISF